MTRQRTLSFGDETFRLPEAVSHGRFGAKKSMETEIGTLRAELDRVFDFIEAVRGYLPEGYEDALYRHEQLKESHAALCAEHQQMSAEHRELKDRVAAMRDTAILQEVGVYDYQHPMENSDEYKDRLKTIRDKIKASARDGGAVTTTQSKWRVNDSEAKGRKMIKDTSKLLLRAYNNEADMLVDKMRPFRLDASVSRLEKSRNAINRLGAQPMEIAISGSYHGLRVTELELVADFLQKKEEEKEAAKAERARLREEARARKELENEKKRLEKERNHYLGVLRKLQQDGDSASKAAEMAELKEKLEELDVSMESVEQRVANVRAGHVYVISNVGSLGERMVKIGMTRRLDPMDRVKELGDASVPFGYDLHAMIFSEDAVDLEKRLHDRFAAQRVNLVNLRREFFYATPQEVHDALNSEDGLAVVTEFTDTPEAAEWHESENTRRMRSGASNGHDAQVMQTT
ncbi:MAG: DUF4041 domain-containing protein [Acidimicrobiales bacterium]|nr:DUF4041 domain-containing protein [Acidimicrobiales bacterium]